MKLTLSLALVLVLAAMFTLGAGQVSGASLSVSPADFTFLVPVGGETKTATLRISNTDSGTMDWVIEPNETEGSLADWLRVEPMGGSIGEPNLVDVTVTVEPVGLATGIHKSSFRVSAPGAIGSPKFVTVVLEIQNPILELPVSNFSPSAYEGGARPSPEVLTVTNAGSGHLTWSADLAGKPDWLSVYPTSGGLDGRTGQPVSLSYHTAGLPVGNYSYGFFISAPGSENSPQAVSINLQVLSAHKVRVPEDYATIQQAVDAVPDGGVIVLRPGTYYENVNGSKIFTLTSTTPDDPFSAYLTILDGSNQDSVIRMTGGHLTLRGLTLQNGLASEEGNGGGLQLNMASGVVSNCIFRDNAAPSGGGIYISGSHGDATLTLERTRFIHNAATTWGGGVCCNSATPYITSCIFHKNTVGIYDGGGVACLGGSAYSPSRSFLRNCLFLSNHAQRRGGGLGADYPIDVTNCTFAGNTSNYGGAIYSFCCTVMNSLFWNNSSSLFGVTDVSYCRIDNWAGGGVGNISGEPLFFDVSGPEPADWDLRQLPGSPCLDAGTNNPAGGLSAFDLDGLYRAWDGDRDGIFTADIGAYEWAYGSGEAYLAATPEAVHFAAYLEQANLIEHQVTIKNYGQQPLTWSIDAATLPEWLLIAPISGNTAPQGSQTTTFSADVSGLAAGTYTYSVTIEAPAASGSPKTILVTLEVIPPLLELSDTEICPAAAVGGPNPDPNVISIRNAGGGPLTWTADLTGKPDWFTMSPTSGQLATGESQSATLSCDITGLHSGHYHYSFPVQSLERQGGVQVVSIDLHVVGSVLKVSTHSLSFIHVLHTIPPAPQSVYISNEGCETIHWFVDANEPLPDWLTVEPLAGGPISPNGDARVTFSIDRSKLPEGQQASCLVPIVTDPVIEDSPQMIHVIFSNHLFKPVGVYGWGNHKTPNALLTRIQQVACGEGFTLALKSNGTLIGFGCNNYGESSVPPGSDYISVAAGTHHGLAVKSDGSLVGWGLNANGQATVPPGNNYIAVTAGATYSLALQSDGTIVGWGWSSSGATNVPDVKDCYAIEAADNFSLALRSDGSLIGWGSNMFGQATPPAGNDYVAVAAGQGHGLALKSDGSIVGWGYNDRGQATPPDGHDYVAIAAGFRTSFALKSDGSVVQWGMGAGVESGVPAGNNVTGITAGYTHQFAIRSDGTMTGWGTNWYGEALSPTNDYVAITMNCALRLDGSLVNLDNQSAPAPSGFDYVEIASGTFHNLALKADGSLVGWGKNDYGQIDVPAGSDYLAVAAGYNHSLALKSDGSVVGWGDNRSGQTTVPPGSYVAIAANGSHSLGLRTDGSLVGWGSHYLEQALTPAGNDYIALAAGVSHSLALRSDGSIIGWGDNWYGQATPPAGNDYIAIAAGWHHSLALKSDSSIVGWGAGGPGKTGYPHYGQSTPPVGKAFTAIAAGGDYSLALRDCGYLIEGDFDNDCRVDSADFTTISSQWQAGYGLEELLRLASTWLGDCWENPTDPSCQAK